MTEAVLTYVALDNNRRPQLIDRLRAAETLQGVLNTLTMNVLDQTRTIGVLRAVGTTRAQVTRSVLAQGVAIALVAVVPAVPVGIGMSWLLHLGSEPLRGFPVAFAVDVPLVVACGCAAVAVACAAATVPAWRAARLPVATTLRRD